MMTTARTWDREDVRQAVRETTAASGVPERITDPVLLDRLAVLLYPTVKLTLPPVTDETRRGGGTG